MGGLGHRPHGPRAPRDPRPARRVPCAEPRGRGRLLAGGDRRRVPRRRRARAAHGYGPDYYGGFLLDPDGNSAEAVYDERAHPCPMAASTTWDPRRRPRGVQALLHDHRAHAGIRLGDDEPGRVQFTGEDYGFSLIDDGRPLTEHVHLAFPAGEDATVRAFHAAASPPATRTTAVRGSAPCTTRLLRRVRPGPRRAQRRSRQPQPLIFATYGQKPQGITGGIRSVIGVLCGDLRSGNPGRSGDPPCGRTAAQWLAFS